MIKPYQLVHHNKLLLPWFNLKSTPQWIFYDFYQCSCSVIIIFTFNRQSQICLYILLLAIKLFLCHITCIKAKIICKILIIFITKLTKTISDLVAMHFYTSDYIAGDNDVESVRFHLSRLPFIVGFSNFDICYLWVTAKLSYILQGV